jgi:hypothetical protein
MSALALLFSRKTQNHRARLQTPAYNFGTFYFLVSYLMLLLVDNIVCKVYNQHPLLDKKFENFCHTENMFSQKFANCLPIDLIFLQSDRRDIGEVRASASSLKTLIQKKLLDNRGRTIGTQ